MKVCLIAEGSYPYTFGGVSAWVQMLIQGVPNVDFSVQTIVASREDAKECKFVIPKNVVSMHDTFLSDDDVVHKVRKKTKLNPKEKAAFKSLLYGKEVDWPTIFNYFERKDASINGLLMGKDFYDIVLEFYKDKYSQTVFLDFLWNTRSLYLLLFKVLKTPMEQCDLYHCVSTGYAGILACKGKVLYNKPLLLCEHGIYTREREEEIIKASWTQGIYKDMWINYFYCLSDCCYKYADKVISLFFAARTMQIDMGCDKEKTRVIPNGVDFENYQNLPGKDEDDHFINVGAMLRVTPIKDVKTLISAFTLAKEDVPDLKLYIMGPTDEDKEYYNDCVEMVKVNEIEDIVFTGRIKPTDYLGKMDMLILTSISEGQPLVMLEAMAVGIPCIATQVGNCAGLIHGEHDDMGDCGIVTSTMNVVGIAQAMVTLAKSPETRRKMGEIGKARVQQSYTKDGWIQKYAEMYSEFDALVQSQSKKKGKARGAASPKPTLAEQAEAAEQAKTAEQSQTAEQTTE